MRNQMKEFLMAEQIWWYSKEGKKYGPETLAELHKLVNTDVLQRDTLVWTDGMDEWLEAQQVKEFNSVFEGPPPLPTDSESISKIYDSVTSRYRDKRFVFEPISAIGKKNIDTENIKVQLAKDVRQKYITILFKTYNTVGIAIGIIVGFILIFIILANSDIRTWFLLVLPFIGYGFGDDITKKIQEKKFKDKSDELIQILYDEYIKNKKTQEMISSISGSIFVLFVIGIFVFSEPARHKAMNIYKNITSNSNCVLQSSSAYKDAFFIKGKSDYGYTVKAKVKNDGELGEISLVAKLITSEGNFTRKQKIQLKANEVRELAYQFPEPTVNVTNVRYKLSCGP